VEQKKDGPADPPEPRELTSWKEMAHHLGVNVRTAQKWEKERGLPVHRASGARGRVSLEVASLDAWKQNLPSAPKPEDRSYCWSLGPGLRVDHYGGNRILEHRIGTGWMADLRTRSSKSISAEKKPQLKRGATSAHLLTVVS
jgi:hypothetical protein